MPTTTLTQVDPEVQRYFDNVLLDREEPDFVHLLFAQERRLPLKSSTTVIFRRYDNLADALTPLNEGVTPDSEQVTKFDITSQISQYGKVVELSDRVLMNVQDETANEVADMLRQNRDSTFDKIVRNMLESTATQIDAINGVNGNAVTEINQTDVDLAVDRLMGNNAKRMAPLIEGQTRDGTAPIRAAYWGVVHTDIRSDLKNVATFVPTAQYPSQMSVLQSELGNTDEVRWVMSSEAQIDTAETPDEYSCFIFGGNAYGVVSVDDVSSEMVIKPLGAGNDPLNQRQTMGWKGLFASVILDDSWLVNLRVTKA
jgi:N4-gp56 family major capsid protein